MAAFYKKKSINDTFIGRTYLPARLAEIFDYLIQNRDVGVPYLQGRSIIYDITERQARFPKFHLPYYLNKESQLSFNKSQDIIIIDNRTPNIDDDKIKTLLAKLEAGWSDDYMNLNYLNTTHLPLRAYTSWISRKLSTRFNFDPKEQNSTAVIAALFYLLQSKSVEELFDGNNLHLTINQIEKATSISKTFIVEFLETFEAESITHPSKNVPPTLKELVNALQNVSPRLKETIQLNSILAVFNHDWFGQSGPLFTTLALEHPPMFLTLLYTSVNNQTYRNSTFSKLVKEYILMGRNKELGERFIKVMNSQLQDLQ